MFPSKSAFCSQFVSAYGPKTGPAFLRFFVLWYVGGGGWGGGGVITSGVYVIIDFFRRTHFMLRCTLLFWAGGGWGGVITSCVYVIIDSLRRTHSMFSLHTSVLGGGWGGGVQQHPVSMLSSIFFGEHASCFVAHVCFNSVNILHVMQVEVVEKNRWRCGETQNHPKNVTFFEDVHCSTWIFELSLQ